MERLRARFRDRASDEVQRLTAALEADDRPGISQISHSLAGNAGMFGFEALGKQAALIEQALEEGADIDSVNILSHALIAMLREIASPASEGSKRH